MFENIPYRLEIIHGIEKAKVWILEHLFVLENLQQLVILIGLVFFARLLRSKLNKSLDLIPFPGFSKRFEKPLKDAISPLMVPIFLIVLLWFSVFVLRTLEQSFEILRLIVSLLNAWVVIRLASSFIHDAGWSKAISVMVWVIAALNIVGLLDVTIAFLDSLSFSFGKMNFSVYGIIKGVIVLAVMFWCFSILENIVKRRIMGLDSITPSAKELLKKFLRIVLIVLAVLIGLDAMGIDLTALAVFSGAIGIGLGFGLQKVASNLVSGVILLMDRSVKPGDVISLMDTYGRINKLGGRYVSVITRDGTEHLIPNEELITQRVENWSFSDTNVRQKCMIGISYESDVRLAMQLCEEAASEVGRVVRTPAPRCLLRDFGDSAVMIEIRFWVNDAHNGLRNVRSEVLLKVWDKFHENGITIPFPQRDINVNAPIPVRLEGTDRTKEPEE